MENIKANKILDLKKELINKIEINLTYKLFNKDLSESEREQVYLETLQAIKELRK